MKYQHLKLTILTAIMACVWQPQLIMSKAMADDLMPMFTIAYFEGACPEGWDNTSLASAAGRTLLPTPRGGGESL